MHLRSAIVAAIVLLFSGAPAAADDYPTRPVRIVVGFGPGATADFAARAVAQKLSLKFGQQFVVESRTAPAATSPPNSSRARPMTAIRC
jgi:tripartite-type tricarboxylate transporter receptor subunit TctC